MARPSPRTHGFTLIELSVILVIIGLITGGVLLGRELVLQAELRHEMGKVESYKTAVNTFRVKYNGLPGDHVRAAVFSLGTNGNGNGAINRYGQAYDYEAVQFWSHLYAAGLIGNAYSGAATPSTGIYGDAIPYTVGLDVPIFKLSGASLGVYVRPADVTNGLNWNMTGNVFELANSPTGVYGYGLLPRSEAFWVDTKFDDGKPGTGNLQGTSNSSGGNGYCASTMDPATAVWPSDPAAPTPRRCVIFVATGF